MRFGVLGNCQVRGLQECLQKMAPGHQFEAVQVEQLQAHDDGALSQIIELAGSVDVLFAHAVDMCVARRGPQQALSEAIVKAQPQYVVTIPTILFSRFHPDCCVIDCNGQYLTTAAFRYHSAIIAGAYLCGLPPQRVPALFNRFVYSGLGYLGGFEQHCQDLRLRFARLGFDAEPLFARQEVFMHCPNHPLVAALFELAGQMLWRVGIEPEPVSPPPDWMAKFTLRWPIYPGLQNGGDIASTALECLHGPRVITLDELIDSSYACYASNCLTSDNCNSPQVSRAALFLNEQAR